MNTISFELAEKLCKLGIREESYMVYLVGLYKTPGKTPELIARMMIPQFLANDIIAAYTLDEILEMLPGHINEYPLYIKVKNPSNRYAVYYLTEDTNRFEDDYYVGKNYLFRFEDENAAEAAGELLAWCIENGHVKVEDLK